MKTDGNSSENLEKVNQESENPDIRQKLSKRGNDDDEKGKRKRKVKEHPTVENCPRTRSRKNIKVIPSVNTIKSVENVVVDDEAEIEHGDEKFDDRDESNSKREKSDRGADHKDNGGKKGDEVDIGGESADHSNNGNDEETMQREETAIETEVHHFLVPTHRETYQPSMGDFVPLGQDFLDKRIDRPRKKLEGATSITRAEAAEGVSDVFGGGSGDGVGAILVAHDTILHRLKHRRKSNLKGGIHEQSLEGSADQNVKTFDLYKPVDIEKNKAYLSWINRRSDEEHIGYTLNMDFRWFKYLSRPRSWLRDDRPKGSFHKLDYLQI
ncbi:hypothetical protein K7X08_037516 [Anisodus acutangulus]|uniref:Uncharacterized protein n=1 Tax=Anisodus acutangulus TaxID=402998 RepID=A0A9Q1MWM3_9SOLA|nr:hypothetical protein K7X08_037516 [Anisodus acutangulus]